ncbi:MAG: elongation factor P [Alphaproteobacteria bacterium]|nr:elongation factor P [Alphaproteobacteria bacterium]
MKVNAITLRSGNVIEYNGRLWVVTKHEINQPGKGASVMQVELRDIRSGAKDNVRFRTQETVERVRLDQEDYQYLYTDDDGCHFMHQGTFEQISISKELIGTPAAYLQEGMIVEVESFEGEALGVHLPDTVVMEIVEADPVIKGQTATTSYKPAILENGERVMVPPHIEAGTRIVVRTEDGSYVERAKD